MILTSSTIKTLILGSEPPLIEQADPAQCNHEGEGVIEAGAYDLRIHELFMLGCGGAEIFRDTRKTPKVSMLKFAVCAETRRKLRYIIKRLEECAGIEQHIGEA